MRIPGELVPHCPVCGKLMYMNLRVDDTFVEDEGWHFASERYAEFLRRHEKTKTLLFEPGCGMNTPGIVKYSFWRMAYERPNTAYACINMGEAFAPKEIAEKAVMICWADVPFSAEGYNVHEVFVQVIRNIMTEAEVAKPGDYIYES